MGETAEGARAAGASAPPRYANSSDIHYNCPKYRNLWRQSITLWRTHLSVSHLFTGKAAGRTSLCRLTNCPRTLFWQEAAAYLHQAAAQTMTQGTRGLQQPTTRPQTPIITSPSWPLPGKKTGFLIIK
ncbi:hypothetical protein E2C01_089241 [Portunus trituberculatus]|uniref:Uncharacterized protein n=1 Tax=Portunus trituberculatus TaxID=210409 RepID=A0A5B7JGP8_PORTR|nr:hypothetical protein [Portunus trituberculatus]